MDQEVTLRVSAEIIHRASEVALRTERSLEEVLIAWLDQSSEQLPVEMLPDEEVLLLCELQMQPDLNDELSELLSLNREGKLAPAQQLRLDELMQIYRRGMVRKAEALKVAVGRNLRALLN